MAAEVQEGWRLHQWGAELTWESFPRPHPGPGHVLVEVEACGVGLTVLNCLRGDLSDDPTLLPLVPGHELVGRVVEVGPGASPRLLGQRVVAYFYRSCGRCLECSAGRQSRCPNLDGWVGVHSDGGYAPWATLPELNAVPVPDGLDPTVATVAPDAVATPLHVCARAAIGPGERVAVIGAGGGVGAHMVQVAALHGARVVGLEAAADKVELLAELGVRGVVSEDFGAVAGEAFWPEGGPTVVVDLVGSDASLRWGVEALVRGGRLVVLTTFRGRQLDVDPRELVFRELALVGSRYAGLAEVAQAAQLLHEGRIRPVIGATVAPEEVAAVHTQLLEGSLAGRGAITWTR